MSTKKPKKTPKIYMCIKCDFKCFNKKDYTRHLNTTKHRNQQNQQEKTQKNPKAISNKLKCVCGKTYKDRSGLWRHKKQCEQVNNKIIITKDKEINDNSTILDLIAQNKELMNLLVVQNQEHKKERQQFENTIQEMVPKLGNTNITNNNNNFNLQVFLNEDCKDALNFSEFINKIQVSFEDLENQADVGYIKGISKLFIENLQELGTNKRPIHCTDKKRKTLYIKENDEWDKEGSRDSLKKGIQEVTRKTQEKLLEEKEINSEEYKDSDSKFFEKCINIQRNLTPDAPRETTINKVMENISKTSEILEK